MNADDPSPGNDNVSTLLQLESMARKAESEKALQFLIVNETRRLLNFRQAFLFSRAGTRALRLEAASSLSVVDRNAPFTNWLENSVRRFASDSAIERIDAASFADEDRERFSALSLPYVIWCPMNLPNGQPMGGIWLSRETPWQDNELVLLERLAETYTHAWGALVGNGGNAGVAAVKRRLWIVPVVLVLIGFLPVRLSTIAPVEVVPLEPLIISAPMDGVIDEVLVSPNSPVMEGEVVFRFEDTNLRNGFEIAQKAYDVAGARLRQASQGAFRDESSKGQVALLQAELELQEAELRYAGELLEQVAVSAPGDGLLVYTDKSDWEGKPVVVGEKVMELVDPERIQLKIDVAVDDAIVIAEDAEVEVFLHADPLSSLQARVTRTGFNAYLTPANILAYKVDAQLVNPSASARLGLQGSARIYGQRVSLFFYLFRRPISALRQFFGL